MFTTAVAATFSSSKHGVILHRSWRAELLSDSCRFKADTALLYPVATTTTVLSSYHPPEMTVASSQAMGEAFTIHGGLCWV